MGKSLGKGIREFKHSVSGDEHAELPRPFPEIAPQASPVTTPAMRSASCTDQSAAYTENRQPAMKDPDLHACCELLAGPTVGYRGRIQSSGTFSGRQGNVMVTVVPSG
jgi:hypothetical protein